eukprot:1573314-Amphidinium_carterae.1
MACNYQKRQTNLASIHDMDDKPYFAKAFASLVGDIDTKTYQTPVLKGTSFKRCSSNNKFSTICPSCASVPCRLFRNASAAIGLHATSHIPRVSLDACCATHSANQVTWQGAVPRVTNCSPADNHAIAGNTTTTGTNM